MIYGYFDTDGRIISAHNDVTIESLPVGAVELTQEQFNQRFDLLLDGDTLLVSPLQNSPVVFTAPTLQDKKEESKTIVDGLKTAKELEGFSYLFGGISETIQIRDERDLINITGVVTTAMLMKQMNIGTTIPFIVASNNQYQMTPDEVIAMGLAASSFVSFLTTKARGYKDSIEKAKSKKAVDDILASISWE